MKHSALTLVLLLSSMGWLSAQVRVEVLLGQEQFLRDESLPVKVRIVNLSGQTLQLGKEADWLSFQLESSDGHSISRLGELAVQDEFSLESAEAATRRIDLMPYYELSRPGRYSLTAKVKLKQWGQEFVSKTQSFEIISGLKIWEQEFGVPASQGPPEVRKYVLQQASYLNRLVLYLRVADARDAVAFRVFPIGPLVSFSRPEAQLDKQSNLHLLSQTGGWSFIYAMVNPQGTVLVRQVYEYTHTRPVLRANEDGKIFVVGGVRRMTKDDLPITTAEPSTNDVKLLKP